MECATVRLEGSGRSRPSWRGAWVIALALLLGVAAPTFGQGVAAGAGNTDSSYAPVQVSGRTLFDVTGNGRLSAVERANRINRRLQTLIERNDPVRPFGPNDVRTEGPQANITLGGDVIMAVTPADAQDSLATPGELALLWGQKMAGAVADARALRTNPLRGAGILLKNSLRDLFVSTVSWLPRLAVALILVVVFWLLARLLAWVVRNIANRTNVDPNLRQLARALAFYGTWTIGAVAILSTMGFQTGGILAALGVSGFVLGFAFKDILSHFLAGVMLLLGRQFRIGDQILVSGQEGTVELIELRALHLRTYDNRLVIIPNADVFNSVITSNTASPYRRREFQVSVDYRQDLRQAMQVALEAVRATPGVLSEPPPDILVDELPNSGPQFRVRFYMNSLRADYLKVGSECMCRVKEAFQREGVVMPVSTMTVSLAEAGQPRLTADPADQPVPGHRIETREGSTTKSHGEDGRSTGDRRAA